MDPYIDTLPHDRGEEIKDLVAERDRSDDEPPLPESAGMDTDELFPPETDRHGPEDSLEPEDDLNNYTWERLQSGLLKINQAAEEMQITPRTRTFLSLYRDAYEVALAGTCPAIASRRVVRAMDDVYHSATWYYRPRTGEEYGSMMCYIELRKLELQANYADFMGQEEGVSVVASSRPPTPLQQQQQNISRRLVDVDVSVLRKNVFLGCGILGLDPMHMRWLLQLWMERGDDDHMLCSSTRLRGHILDCYWPRVAEQVCRDLKELVNIMGGDDDWDVAKGYERVMVGIRDMYFRVYNRDEWQHWIPNERAKGLSDEKFGE